MNAPPAHFQPKRLIRAASCLLMALAWFTAAATAQTTLLDSFDTLVGWHPIVSEGAHLQLSEVPGKDGGALCMAFDLSSASGYVIAEKAFDIDMPAAYRFTFDIRATAPDNNFEFKLIDDRENVFWLKNLDVAYPKTWTRQHISNTQISFAWGPTPDSALRRVRRIQFVVSTGSGGRGKVYIDNFRFERIDTAAEKSAVAEIVGKSGAEIDRAGTVLLHWRSRSPSVDSLTVDFHRTRDLGALILDWAPNRFASAYDILLSDDGRDWSSAYSVTNGNGGRDYVFINEGEGRFVRLLVRSTNARKGCTLRRMELKGAISINDFFRLRADNAPPGDYPRYFRNEQSYWTVAAVDGDAVKPLINEEGQIEVSKRGWSLEPFLYVDGRLVTWHDVTRTAALREGYLPIPSVRWQSSGGWTLTTEALPVGVPDSSFLFVRYSFASRSFSGTAGLFVAIRPFQVNPPWQKLNIEGGVSRIDSIRFQDGRANVNAMAVIPLTRPGRFGAAPFDRGSVTEYLRKGECPPAAFVHDPFGRASGALSYDLNVRPGDEREVILAIPLHHWTGGPVANGASAHHVYDSLLANVEGEWKERLNRVQLMLPPQAQEISNTFRTNIATMFVERVGSSLRPATRSYDRSWIRDGSMMCAALLGSGYTKEIREFIDWYASYQYATGSIPCVVDARGADATPEHDSHGEFIFAVHQYFRYSHDTTWLRKIYGRVVKTVEYIDSLRQLRKTAAYKSGSPEEQACYGLLPASISHEGYSSHPRHSYWDDFWALRGLKDAVAIAEAVDDDRRAATWKAVRDDFRTDLYASMRLAMDNNRIDYIPGCAELGDFDPTSTTIGVLPGGELGHIPEPQLHNTFDRYYEYLTRRKSDTTIVDYTPYEMRAIGTFVCLNEKERANEALEFFMNDRRPQAWNTWAEVVWRDPRTPRTIGDMPHAWVGSDFIRSILSMFVYERESDTSFVLCGGIPDAWISDPAGVGVRNLPTPYGLLSYAVKRSADGLTVELSGSFSPGAEKLILHSPLSVPIVSATIDEQKVPVSPANEILIRSLPANVLIRY